MLDPLLGVLCIAILVVMLVVVAATVTSWFAVQPGSVMERVSLGLQTAVDPLLGPLRHRLPRPQVAGVPLDLSPLVVLVALEVLRLLIGC